MANEIMVLNRRTVGEDGHDEEFTFLFFFPLNPPITIDDGNYTVVPTHSSTLPDLVLDAGILGAAELAALDSGDAAFTGARPQTKPAEESKADFLVRVQNLYRGRVDFETQRLRDFYSNYGLRLDAE